MRVVEYREGDVETLEKLRRELPGSSPLRWRSFVDYYYGRGPFAQLYILMDGNDHPLATLGCEFLPFKTAHSTIILGFGSNAYAFQPGAGAVLFEHYLDRCDFGIEFGGSEDAHRVLRHQNWKYFPGVPVFHLNKPIVVWPSDTGWKRCAKAILSCLGRDKETCRRIERVIRRARHQVDVEETDRVAPDMIPSESPFTFRCAPSIEHLNWRYSSCLSFVRYRIFRIVHASSKGYVIINQLPNRTLVAHCDGDDPQVLALGVIAAIHRVAVVERRKGHVSLTCTHPEMQSVFHRAGFRCDRVPRPFAIGRLRGSAPPPIPNDPNYWLLSFDIGDNGLRPPFLC